jgi:hypothetical protein
MDNPFEGEMFCLKIYKGQKAVFRYNKIIIYDIKKKIKEKVDVSMKNF